MMFRNTSISLKLYHKDTMEAYEYFKSLFV